MYCHRSVLIAHITHALYIRLIVYPFHKLFYSDEGGNIIAEEELGEGLKETMDYHISKL
jgi:hypothetical protein